MARVIRACWVYKPLHTYRYLPRPPTGTTPFDYDEFQSNPEDFPDKLEEAPKLWVAWIYRRPFGPKWIKRDLKFLFGEELEVGKMEIFKNTESWNKILWRVKHLIEIRPVTFPYGEPTEADTRNLRVEADGKCLVDKKLEVSPDTEKLAEEVDRKNFSASYLLSYTTKKWHQQNSVHEDSVDTLEDDLTRL